MLLWGVGLTFKYRSILRCKICERAGEEAEGRAAEDVMALHDRVQYLRREHEEIARLMDTLEEFLVLTSSEEFNRRAQGLTELRALDHHMGALIEHCHSEDRAVESLYDRYLQQEERKRINLEHQEIIRLVDRFRDELRFSTADHTTTLSLWGKELVSRMRSHSAYEEILLNRVDALSALPEEVVERYMHSSPGGTQAPPN